MMYGPVKQKLAPASFAKVTKNGVPWMTTPLMVLVMAVGGL